MDTLLVLFPDQANEIGRLRSADTVFAQICADYESLTALMPCDAKDPTYSDLIESLRGLEDEIRLYLASRSQPPES
ncbi:hypothetical protein [Ruegeria sp. ANG-S4]|uniref:hypothetical protein n=1 Tax=Ruegeria sp. ANG-S4 TaxID=1577904 RepID=UPI0005800BC2|nr:hypothetical protein [Ruegeria sp. ANG-S4]